MRAFLAIELDESARRDLAAVCETARRAVPSWEREKWVPEQNLHVTLRFLDEIDASMAQRLAEELRNALSTYEPFALPCAVAVEPVPGARRARMLWARYDDPDGRCASLARAVADTLAPFGIPPDERPFVPHVTLARARRPRPFPSPAAADHAVCAPVSVREVTLFESVLGRSAPVYTRWDRIPLGAR